MKKPLHQQIILLMSWIVGSVAAFGTILGAISSSISLVPPIGTYVGTVFILIMWIILDKYLQARPLRWIFHGNQEVRLNRLGKVPQVALIGIIILLWVPRIPEFIKKYSDKERRLPEVSVKLVNHRNTDVEIYYRGEFILWFPEGVGGLRTTQGRVELHQKNRQIGDEYTFLIPAQKEVDLYARVLNPSKYYDIFEAGDTDLSISVRRTDGGVEITDTQLPFSRKALSEGYVQIDIRDR